MNDVMNGCNECFPSDQHRLLNVFVGRWNTVGETLDGTCLKINALDVYEWLPGRHFLLHKWDARVGEQYVNGIEVISFDFEADSYRMKFFDSEGNSGQYQLSFSEDRWLINSDAERAQLQVVANAGKMYAEWQRHSASGFWCSWMKVELTRVDGSNSLDTLNNHNYSVLSM